MKKSKRLTRDEAECVRDHAKKLIGEKTAKGVTEAALMIIEHFDGTLDR